MIPGVTFRIECKRFYIETLDRKTRKKVSVPVTIRKMYMTDHSPIGDSGVYRIVQVKRKGSITYSLSALPIIPQSIWSNPSGRAHPWHKVGTEYDRKGMGPAMSEGDFLRWLIARVGPSMGPRALEAMLNAVPEAAAAA